ncbi:MAG: hypothetical protein Q9169_007996, partial [Polycauliona sp. 2 TL-2023]
MIQLNVGAEKALFHVHKGLICESSPFFKAAFTGEFKEEKSGSMLLDEDDPHLFGHVVQWLYHGKLKAHSNLETDTDNEWEQLCRLYILA